MEWLVPRDKEVVWPLDGYIVSFLTFHERDLASPPHRFLCGLLHYYGLEIQHLTPNGIQHIATSVALYEGFLGVDHTLNCGGTFLVSSSRIRGKFGTAKEPPISCASIHLRGSWASKYNSASMIKINKGWHTMWFYLKDIHSSSLLAFMGLVIVEQPTIWSYCCLVDRMEKLTDLGDALRHLINHNMMDFSVISAYHALRVAPLMDCCL
jgi:hypothetical protein